MDVALGVLLGLAVAAPPIVQDRYVGALVALYEHGHRMRPEDARALRARISPQLIHNSLAAIASYGPPW